MVRLFKILGTWSFRVSLSVAVILLSVSTQLFAGNNTFRPIYLNAPTLLNESLDIEKVEGGYMWIATSEGVVRYDGCQAKRYRCDYNFLRSIHQLSDGTIMLLDTFKPLSVRAYNPISDQFATVDIGTLSSSMIAECGAVDTNNNLWIGSSNGILCYSGDSDRWSYFAEFRDTEIKSIVAIGDSIAFVTSSNRLIIASVDTASGELRVEEDIKFPCRTAPKTALYDSLTRSLHYGMNEEGLYTFSLVSNKFSKHSNLHLDNIPIKSIVEFDEDYLLIGTDGLGILKVRRSDLSLAHQYNYSDPYNFSIQSNAIYDVYVDSKGRIYAATYAHGVNVLDPKALDYELIVPRGASGESVLSTVNALYEDSDGSLWMGTNDGIYSISKDRKRSALYSFDSKIKSRNRVILTIDDFDGDVYAGGYGSGLLRVDRAKGILRSVPYSNDVDNSNFLFALHNDGGEEFWLGGIDSKLMSYNRRSGIFECYGDNTGVSSIAKFSATELIYCADYKLYLYNKVSHKVTPFELDLSTIGSLGAEPKIHLLRRYNDTIYFATNDNGLLSYNVESHTTTSYSSMLDREYSNILSIEVDNRGDVWLATSSGVAYLNMQENYAKCYKELGSVRAGSFIKGASLVTRDGRVIFGTLNGALSINSNSYSRQGDDCSAPTLTDFKISYNSILQDTTLLQLASPLDELEDIKLSYSQNTFSLHFTQIDFSRYERSSFSWRLDGYDEQWSPVGLRVFAEYRNVPSGEYTFRLRAYNAQNFDSYTERAIHIKVLTPWYWSWYMILVYLLLVAMSVAGLFKFYHQKSQQRLSQERIDNYINTLHSLLTPITLIKAPIESLKREIGEGGSSSHLLDIVSRNIDRLHTLISRQSEFKSVINEAQDLQELSLNDYFRDLNDSFWEYALINNVKLSLDAKQPNILVYISREALDKIMDNLLLNAIKYSCGRGEVNIVTDYNSSYWSVQVTNQGASIPSGDHRRVLKYPYRADNSINRDEPSGGMGLFLTHKLVKAMGGDITFVSSESRGTSFTVRFPMNMVKERTSVDEVIDDRALESVSDIRTTPSIITTLDSDMITSVYIGVEESQPSAEAKSEDLILKEEDRIFIDHINEIIRLNLANQDFSIDTLCSDLFMSRSAFYNKMKRITNLTPNEMLRRARMESAVELLQSGKYSVQVVSDMVGFSDAKYFSKVFYKYYNCYPSKYNSSK